MNSRNFFIVLFSLFLFLQFGTAALADEGSGEIPGKVPRTHWSYAAINDLASKYGVEKKLPEKDELERKELAVALLEVLNRVLTKCERQGSDSVSREDLDLLAVSREDLDLLAVLYQVLKEDLAQDQGYLQRREAIERILAKPETPPFLYKVGVNGFVRGEGAGNFRLSDSSFAPAVADGRFVYRVKPYAYWHPTDWLDLHVEGEGYGFAGTNDQDHSEVSLYQGFAEARLPGSDLLSLKGGRQEFVYGSAFVLGANAFYQGLTYDAARLRVKPLAPLTIDLLGGTYADPFSGGVGGNLEGGYLSYAFSDDNAAEAYAFRDTGSTDHHPGEYLAIWGVRGTAKLGPVALECEPIYESGRTFNSALGRNEQVDAFGGHLDASLGGVLAGHNNKLFTSFAYGSGGSAAANGVSASREFRNPDNDSSLVGDMHVVGDLSGITVTGATGEHHASGLQIYTLGWGMDMTKELNFSATGRYFIANRVESGFSDHLGLETDFTLTWNLEEGVSLIAGYDRFFTAGFFRDASGSGRDIDYGYLMLQFDLSHQKPKASRKLEA